MKRGRAYTAALLLLLALGGCGEARKTIETVGPDQSSAANICFLLEARLEGIEHTHALIDPEPAALRGRLPAQRVARASEEAIDASRQTESDLQRKHPPAASLHGLREAERSFRRLGRTLRGASAADGSVGLRMQFAFLKIAAGELRECRPPR